MREKNIEDYLRIGVKNLGGRAYKFVSPGNAGVPDRLVVWPNGRVVFVELKAPCGKLSKMQAVQIERLRKLGQDVSLLCSMEDVDIFLGVWEAVLREI